jgi:hypothetical protein
MEAMFVAFEQESHVDFHLNQWQQGRKTYTRQDKKYQVMRRPSAAYCVQKQEQDT